MALHRRHLLAALAAAPIAAFAGNRKPVAEHWTQGGMGGLLRARYGFSPYNGADSHGYPCTLLPAADVTYMQPMTVMEFDESQGTGYPLPQLLGDGTATVMQSGNYRLTFNEDWAAQQGVAINARKIEVLRVQAGQTPPVYVPGALTALSPNNGYDVLTSHDTAGSNVPQTSRASLAITGGVLLPGVPCTFRIPLTDPAVAIGLGDSAIVGYTAALPPGVLLQASVDGPGSAQASFVNVTNAPVTLPRGTLRVVAQTTVATAGTSIDAWSYATSPIVQLLERERIIVAVRSLTARDELQVDNASFLQVERVS